jgi:hypothetical protein
MSEQPVQDENTEVVDPALDPDLDIEQYPQDEPEIDNPA